MLNELEEDILHFSVSDAQISLQYGSLTAIVCPNDHTPLFSPMLHNSRLKIDPSLRVFFVGPGGVPSTRSQQFGREDRLIDVFSAVMVKDHDAIFRNCNFKNIDLSFHSDFRLSDLSLTDRVCLSVSIGLHIKCNMVIFSTAGLDPMGIYSVAKIIELRDKLISAVHISHANTYLDTRAWFAYDSVYFIEKI